MTRTLIWIAYIVVGVCLWPWFARVVLRTVLSGSKPESFDYVMATLFGAVCAIFWPFCLIIGAVAAAIRRGDEAEPEKTEDPSDRSWW